MSEKYIKQIDKKLMPVIKFIGQKTDKLGIRAYLVGGIVRDALLKRKNFDVDIVIDKQDDILLREISRSRKVQIKRFKQFQTAKIIFPDGIIVDIAHFRKENYLYPGALPAVSPGAFSSDMTRRDFTINTMAMSINKKTFGEVYDILNGAKDIRTKNIRIIHNKSFEDDPTRILRAVRFEQRFGFKIESDTMKLINKAIAKDFPSTVKPQRYFTEFKRILFEEDVVKYLNRLNKLGALKFIDKNVNIDKKVIKNIEKEFNSAKAKLDKDTVWLFYFFALIEGCKEDRLDYIKDNFGLKKEEKDCVVQIPCIKEIRKELSSKRIRKSEVYELLKGIAPTIVDYLSVSSSDKQARARVEYYKSVSSKVELKITGSDVKKCHKSAGKRIGELLDIVLHEKIDKGFKGKADEIKFLKSLS